MELYYNSHFHIQTKTVELQVYISVRAQKQEVSLLSATSQPDWSYMVSADLTTLAPSNRSIPLLLNATFDEENKVAIRQAIQIEEFLVVLIVVIFWVVAFMAFLKKWDSIRIMQPMEPRYKHTPKNLENIKIVKRPQDSIIYKNYSRKMSTTMVARENRRLQRMHTVACMGTLPGFPIQGVPPAHIHEAITEV